MFAKFRFVLLALLLVTLVGCSGVAAGVVDQVEPVDSTNLVRSMQWVNGRATGPVYSVEMTVPESWVDSMVTRTRGNTVAFMYPQANGEMGIVFEVQALSERQYWQQVGSYPGLWVDIANKVNTYFVYQVPIFAPESGMPAELLDGFREEVSAVVRSFSANQVQVGAALYQP
jgi:hypothetical protein